VEYLNSVERRGYDDNVVRSILKFPGALAGAAPAEFAKLIEAALIPSRRARERSRDRTFGPFNLIDHELYAASPAQDPFLELLTNAPAIGIPLVRRLVDHAIVFHTSGRAPGDDVIHIPFTDGEREFPWTQSYAWSREYISSSVTSALKALEAWGHKRIQDGESFELVLSDVLDGLGAPAAFLLVAVDLLLSHWPKSRDAAIPFLGCPELVCIDRERRILDNVRTAESGEAANLSNINKSSRRLTLEDLFGLYAGDDAKRNLLIGLLGAAAERLGGPDAQSTLGDPAFMVVHAINMLDPGNWKDTFITRRDGSKTPVREYVPPELERRHLQYLQDASRDRFADSDIVMRLGVALDKPERSSPELAAASVAWAQRQGPPAAAASDDAADQHWMRDQAVVTAAMIAMRDGDRTLRADQRTWARSVFEKTFRAKPDPVHRSRTGIRFNAPAQAFAGMVYLLRDDTSPANIRTVLEMAASKNPAGAHGLGVSATTLAAIDERLPRSVLRCAFAACVQPRRDLDLSPEQMREHADHYQSQITAAIDAEMAWLQGEGLEPVWPTFPEPILRPRRRRLCLPGGRASPEPVSPKPPEMLVDERAAALWLSNAARLFRVAERPWLRDVARTYASWTGTANGSDLSDDQDAPSPPMEWNDAYFALLARCLPGWGTGEIDEVVLTPIRSMPDESFLDVAMRFVRSVDVVHFGTGDLVASEAARIRSALAERLMETCDWRWLAHSRSTSITMDVAPSVAVFFFNDYSPFGSAECYLNASGIEYLGPFIPVLKQLVEGGPSLFVAGVTLNLLEVSTKSQHLPLIMSAAKAWLLKYPEDRDFWDGQNIDPRLCRFIDAIRLVDPELFNTDQALRDDLDRLLSALVRLGVPEAHTLEAAFAGRPDRARSSWPVPRPSPRGDD
jgi:hypothetical protein